LEIVSRNVKSARNTFYIRATHKSTRRTSCINNLNAILSELGVDSNKPEFADSMWEIPEKQAIRFVNISKDFLVSPVFRDYLENRLDEDRAEGEWANIWSSRMRIL